MMKRNLCKVMNVKILLMRRKVIEKMWILKKIKAKIREEEDLGGALGTKKKLMKIERKRGTLNPRQEERKTVLTGGDHVEVLAAGKILMMKETGGDEAAVEKEGEVIVERGDEAVAGNEGEVAVGIEEEAVVGKEGAIAEKAVGIEMRIDMIDMVVITVGVTEAGRGLKTGGTETVTEDETEQTPRKEMTGESLVGERARIAKVKIRHRKRTIELLKHHETRKKKFYGKVSHHQ